MDRVRTLKALKRPHRRSKARSRRDAKEEDLSPDTVEEMMLCHAQQDTWEGLYLGSF